MPNEFPVEEKPLFTPPLEKLAQTLNKGLQNYFAEVSVEVTDCPDLSNEPFRLACDGLGGSPRLLEVGGPPYLIPLYQKEKVYDFKNLSKAVKLNPCFIIGAGAGPWMHAGKNCEMMANVFIDGEKIGNRTHIAKIKDDGSNFCLEELPSNETRFALLGNFLCCQGTKSKVLKVICRKRVKSDNFISSIRLVLENEFKHEPVGLGGVFLTKSGKAKHHVMPDFSKEPLTSEEALNKWLRFFELSAPLVSVGTLVSNEIKGLDLRLQHFHSFSNHGEGGHYHYDTTPDEVEYEGYFNLAECIFRVDKPTITHSIGKD